MKTSTTINGNQVIRKGGDRVVVSETDAGKTRADMKVTSTTKDGTRTTLRLHDSFVDDSKDSAHVKVERLAIDPKTNKPDPDNVLAVLADEPLTFDQFYAKRKEVVEPMNGAGVKWGFLKLTYAAKYDSAMLVSSGHDAEGNERHVHASLGVHSAFPFPGEHWDEGQIAILDDKFNPLMTLRMPKDAEKTHLDVRLEDFETPGGGKGKRITYSGHMEDDTGALRFVEAHYDLSKTAIKRKNPTWWNKVVDAINKTIGFEQKAKLLKNIDAMPSSLRVDGKEMLKIESTRGAIDDGARFNVLPNSSLLAINYAPADVPLVSSFDVREGEARYRFDAKALHDKKGIARLIPDVLKRGLLMAHYTVDDKARRKPVSEKMTFDDRPISTKFYTWKWNSDPKKPNTEGKPVAMLCRQLVRCWDPADPKADPELAFRELIVKWQGSEEATTAYLNKQLDKLAKPA